LTHHSGLAADDGDRVLCAAAHTDAYFARQLAVWRAGLDGREIFGASQRIRYRATPPIIA
jgi:hypothetical protein